MSQVKRRVRQSNRPVRSVDVSSSRSWSERLGAAIDHIQGNKVRAHVKATMSAARMHRSQSR